jgi:uncharacterized membrane protein YhaH (DUF805 family)
MSAKTSKEINFEVLKERYIAVLQKYAVIKGRARRQEFWTFFFCNLAIGLALGVLSQFPGIGKLFYAVSGLFSLAIIIPNFTVGIRRLHDTNRSGFWLFLSLIPIAGIITLIVWAAQEGTGGSNQYGPNPKSRR